jgi:hypothetical protein
VKKKRNVPKRQTQLYWETSEQGRKETQQQQNRTEKKGMSDMFRIPDKGGEKRCDTYNQRTLMTMILAEVNLLEFERGARW